MLKIGDKVKLDTGEHLNYVGGYTKPKKGMRIDFLSKSPGTVVEILEESGKSTTPYTVCVEILDSKIGNIECWFKPNHICNITN